ncbi:MAG: hypothetical protein WD021_04425 [Rhodothermales bacterium]
MMKACYKYVLGTALLFALAVMSADSASAQFTSTWIDIGDFQDKYSQVGVIDESSNDHDYPAIQNRSEHGRSEGFWIGAKNWTNPDGQTFEYFTSKIGPRDTGVDFAFPVEAQLISKWEDTEVNVDGVASFDKIAVVDEVDPSLPADRVHRSVWNMDIGVTIEMTAYAFSNPFHDEYHIVDWQFTNSGNTDDDPDIELEGQTLNETFFYVIHRWRGSDQAARVGDNGQVWGKYAMNDVVGDGHMDYPVDFTAYYLWKGFEPGFTRWNNLGGPLLEQCCDAALGDSVGRLTSGFDGEIVLYAPNSMDDPTYDMMVQPHTIGFLDSDEKLNALGASHREYYEDGILTRERQTRTPEVSPSRTWPHYADRIEPDGEFWDPSNDPSSGRQGGHAVTVGFGPYDMEFGESVRVVVARGVGALDFDAQLYIGRQYKLSGADDEMMIAYDANNDGVIEDKEYSYHDVYDLGDEVMTKNQWVMTGRDSLFNILSNARDVYEASNDLTEYPVVQPPLPPRTFNVRGLPDGIELEWEPLEGGPARAGWEVYRSVKHPYWSPAWDNVRSPSGGMSLLEALEDPTVRLRRTEDELPYTCVAGARPDCLQPALGPGATSFTDTGVNRGTDYYYYLAAVGEENPVDPDAINGTPGGVALRSSRYFTQTYQAVNLKRPPYGPTGTIEDARVVPNPVNLGSDQSIRFTKEDEVAFFNIPGECTIKIYTEIGELVETIEHTDGSGDEKWNLTTSSRQLLVSGIYIAVIEEPNGDRVFRKFTVIR